MGALSGIRVIDLTNAIAGASSTRLLAEHGADVVKIESPDGGDFTRTLMPFVFRAHNRNKRSVTIDLRTGAGTALVRRLVRDADVFVQSLRPGAAAALGLDRDTLMAENPALIHASFSAFPADGMSAARRGVDAVVQAESGMVQVQGGLLGNVSYIDATAGLALSHAILAALLNRERTGAVDFIEVNLLDTALYMQSATLAEFSVTGKVPDQDAYRARFPMVGLFPASDGQLQCAVYRESEWIALCNAIGLPELTEDPRFRTPQGRQRHDPELRTILSDAFRTRPRHQWTTVLNAAGILAGKVRDYAEIVADARSPDDRQFDHHPVADSIATFARAPYRLNTLHPAPARPAPLLGEDTRNVLAEAGLNACEIAALVEDGVIVLAAGSGDR